MSGESLLCYLSARYIEYNLVCREVYQFSASAVRPGQAALQLSSSRYSEVQLHWDLSNSIIQWSIPSYQDVTT